MNGLTSGLISMLRRIAPSAQRTARFLRSLVHTGLLCAGSVISTAPAVAAEPHYVWVHFEPTFILGGTPSDPGASSGLQLSYRKIGAAVEDTNCVEVRYDAGAVRLQVDTAYKLIWGVSKLNLCDGWAVFTNLSECYGLQLSAFHHIDPPYYAIWETDADDGVAFFTDSGLGDTNLFGMWSVVVAHYKGQIDFDGCKRRGRAILRADQQSTVNAFLTNSNLRLPLQDWAIEQPTLGCDIISEDGDSCKILAGGIPGTIWITAEDQDGCIVRAPLDLVDPDEGCGEGGCGGGQGSEAEGMTFGEGRARLPASDRLTVGMSLGQSKDGLWAGDLVFQASHPTNLTYSPTNLAFRWWREDVFKATNDSGIQQIKAPQGLADVVVSNANVFDVKFYAASNVGARGAAGYRLTNSPLSVWTFENPDAGTRSNRLVVTHKPAGQDPVAYEYAWLTNGWELSSAGGLRVETVMRTSVTNGPAIFHTDTWQIRQGTGPVVAQRTLTLEQRSSKFWPREETWGTGGNARTNSYTWNLNDTLREVVHADGSWEIHEYDSEKRPTRTYSAYLNQTPTTNSALCRVLDQEYGSVSGSDDDPFIFPRSPRKTVERIQDTIVRLTYHAYGPGLRIDVQCLSTNAVWNTTGNLHTTNRAYTGTYFEGWPKSVERPD